MTQGGAIVIHDRRVLAVIPARSGSKGLPDKNIRELGGIPLLARSIRQAQETGIMDEIFLSTDSPVYAELAVRYGANVPFLRSRELASDSASAWDCVREALGRYRALGQAFDIFVLLQPTSPLRSAGDILGAVRELTLRNADSVISVCEAEHSPLWCGTLPEDRSLQGFVRPEVMALSRQELPVFYRFNGAVYAVETSFFLRAQNICDGDSFAYVMPRERSVDIDTLLDFTFAEFLLARKNAGEGTAGPRA
jgi:CMP-N,N'-diacetyllegionaminic acid synthase